MMIAASFALAACAPRPMVRAVPAQPAPPPQTEVYFYPLKNQNARQQDRDRYECYLWAKKQTGFDPSAPQLAPHQRFEVVPGPLAPVPMRHASKRRQARKLMSTSSHTSATPPWNKKQAIIAAR